MLHFRSIQLGSNIGGRLSSKWRTIAMHSSHVVCLFIGFFLTDVQVRSSLRSGRKTNQFFRLDVIYIAVVFYLCTLWHEMSFLKVKYQTVSFLQHCFGTAATQMNLKIKRNIIWSRSWRLLFSHWRQLFDNSIILYSLTVESFFKV